MSKQALSGYWKVYFETKHLDYQPTLDWLTKESKGAIWYYHPGGKLNPDRPHIHGLLLDCQLTAEGIRKRLKKTFELTNKTEFAISNTYERGSKMSEFTYKGYITYMSKGIYNPLSPIKHFTEVDAEMAKLSWKELDKQTEEKQTIVIEPREKVMKKLTLYQSSREAEIRYLQRFPDDEKLDHHKFIPVAVEVLHENKIQAHYRNVAQMYQDVLASQDMREYVRRVEKFI